MIMLGSPGTGSRRRGQLALHKSLILPLKGRILSVTDCTAAPYGERKQSDDNDTQAFLCSDRPHIDGKVEVRMKFSLVRDF
jgi:hypothetical protein